MAAEGEKKEKAAEGISSKGIKKPIPHVPPPTMQQKLLFGAGVATILVVAAVRTYTKVRAGEPIPGYTQATYMKKAE